MRTLLVIVALVCCGCELVTRSERPLIEVAHDNPGAEVCGNVESPSDLVGRYCIRMVK
jgi:hypothetical protein